jgi:hypothetical protein
MRDTSMHHPRYLHRSQGPKCQVLNRHKHRYCRPLCRVVRCDLTKRIYLDPLSPLQASHISLQGMRDCPGVHLGFPRLVHSRVYCRSSFSGKKPRVLYDQVSMKDSSKLITTDGAHKKVHYDGGIHNGTLWRFCRESASNHHHSKAISSVCAERKEAPHASV